MPKKKVRPGIQNITLHNFKGTSYPRKIPIKPVTFLFGANSAGKSTILQAIHYAKEVLFNKNADPYETIDGINLGGFLNIVNKHDFKNVIGLSFDLNLYDDGLPVYMNIDEELKEAMTSVNEKLKKVTISIKTTWDTANQKAFITGLSIGLNEDDYCSIAAYSSSAKPVIDFINPDHVFLKKIFLYQDFSSTLNL